MSHDKPLETRLVHLKAQLDANLQRQQAISNDPTIDSENWNAVQNEFAQIIREIRRLSRIAQPPQGIDLHRN
jgi:hypothetical protein